MADDERPPRAPLGLSITTVTNLVNILIALAAIFLFYQFVSSVTKLQQGVVNTAAAAKDLVKDTISDMTKDIHQHKEFMDDFLDVLKESTKTNVGPSLKQVAQDTGESLAIVTSHMKLIKQMQLNEHEFEMTRKAEGIVGTMQSVVLGTHDIAEKSSKMMRGFLKEIPLLLASFKQGEYDQVLKSLSEIQKHIGDVAGYIIRMQTNLDHAYVDTKELQDLATAAMERLSREAEMVQGNRQYPYTSIALFSVVTGLSAVVAMTAAPAVVPALAVGGAAKAVGAATFGAALKVQLEKRAESDVQARQLSVDAGRLANIAVSCQSIMQGVQAFNASLEAIASRVEECSSSAKDMKKAVWTHQHAAFEKAVDAARDRFGELVEEYEELLRTWYDESV
jgi:hypothetical protein